jgi:hypothetical protein
LWLADLWQQHLVLVWQQDACAVAWAARGASEEMEKNKARHTASRPRVRQD